MSRVFLTMILIMFLTGCASTANHYTQTVESWRGGTAGDLMTRWGAPYKRIMANNGNVIYVYKTKSYRVTPAAIGPNLQVKAGQNNTPSIYISPNPNSTWFRGSSYSCIAAFKANRTGTIIGTETQGTGCYGSANFAARMSNPRSVNI